MSAKPDYGFIDSLNLDDDFIDQILTLAGLTSMEDDPEMKLSQLLFRTEEGSDSVMLSPIAKRIDPKTILERWDKIYDSSDKFISEDLSSLEALNRDKFGPRSIAQPWESRKSAVMEYFEADSNVSSTVRDRLQNVLDSETATPHSLRPLQISNALSFIKNNTNSGLPFLNRKSYLKPSYEIYLQEIASRKDPCVLFTRTAEQGRTRTVFGFPMGDTILEMAYYRPLLEYQKKLQWRTSLKGPEETDTSVWRLLLRAQVLDWFVVSNDCSRFDTTIKRTLQSFGFEYIKKLFQQQYGSELDERFERFNTIGLVTPDGIISRPGGIPSGSTFTNEVGSIVQYLLLKGAGLLEEWFNIQGDDAVFITDNVENVQQFYTDAGLIVNEEKSYVRKTSCVYLQKIYDLEHYNRGSFGGIYPTYRALTRIIYPERFITFTEGSISGQDYFAIRTIAILENCKHHPLFNELVRFVYDLDSYKLNFSEMGLRNYVKLIAKTKGSEDIISNQYGEDLTGINSFETVRLIKSFKS